MEEAPLHLSDTHPLPCRDKLVCESLVFARRSRGAWPASSGCRQGGKGPPASSGCPTVAVLICKLKRKSQLEQQGRLRRWQAAPDKTLKHLATTGPPRPVHAPWAPPRGPPRGPPQRPARKRYSNRTTFQKGPRPKTGKTGPYASRRQGANF